MTKDKISPRELGRLAERFRALSEVSRLSIVVALQKGPLRVTELSRRTGLSQPNVSRHLKILVDAGLIARTRKGTTIECRIADETLFEVCRLVCGREG